MRSPMDRLRRKLTVETLWLYILAVLEKHGPTYAYNIKRLIRETFGFTPSTMTLYSVVYRLEKAGLLDKIEDGSYRVTDLGRKSLEEGIQFIRGITELLEKAARGDGSSGP